MPPSQHFGLVWQTALGQLWGLEEERHNSECFFVTTTTEGTCLLAFFQNLKISYYRRGMVSSGIISWVQYEIYMA